MKGERSREAGKVGVAFHAFLVDFGVIREFREFRDAAPEVPHVGDVRAAIIVEDELGNFQLRELIHIIRVGNGLRGGSELRAARCMRNPVRHIHVHGVLSGLY